VNIDTGQFRAVMADAVRQREDVGRVVAAVRDVVAALAILVELDGQLREDLDATRVPVRRRGGRHAGAARDRFRLIQGGRS
jgi:hypothetical protein